MGLGELFPNVRAKLIPQYSRESGDSQVPQTGREKWDKRGFGAGSRLDSGCFSIRLRGQFPEQNKAEVLLGSAVGRVWGPKEVGLDLMPQFLIPAVMETST